MNKLHRPKHYAGLSGQAADTILAAVHGGELKASDLRRPGARRPRWFIAEHDWQIYLDARSNMQAEPVVNRKPPNAGQYV